MLSSAENWNGFESMKLETATNPHGLVKKSELKVVVRELTRIEKRDGKLKPESIVNEARPESSNLHKYFTWEDNEAAELYRRVEARMLIRSVTVIYDGAKEHTSTRAYVSVITHGEDGSDRGYMGMARVLSDADLRAQMLEDALDEAQAWRTRYQHLNELASIFEAIDKAA